MCTLTTHDCREATCIEKRGKVIKFESCQEKCVTECVGFNITLDT